MVRQRSAKPLFSGSNPDAASIDHHRGWVALPNPFCFGHTEPSLQFARWCEDGRLARREEILSLRAAPDLPFSLLELQIGVPLFSRPTLAVIRRLRHHGLRAAAGLLYHRFTFPLPLRLVLRMLAAAIVAAIGLAISRLPSGAPARLERRSPGCRRWPLETRRAGKLLFHPGGCPRT